MRSGAKRITALPVSAAVVVSGALLVSAAAFAVGASPAAAYLISGKVPDLPTGAHAPRAARPLGANVDYQGGPVMHSNRTHIIFWDPSGAGLSWDPGYVGLVAGFFANVAADSRKPSNVFGLTGQYTDSGGPAAYVSSYGGVIADTDPAPASDCAPPPTAPPSSICLSDAAIKNELGHVVTSRHLPIGQRELYFMVLPAGFEVCASTGLTSCSLGGTAPGSFCGYHSAFGLRSDPLIYALIPYNNEFGHCSSDSPQPNGSADPSINSASHEQSESITDPLPAGPGNSQSGWVDSSGMEVGDLCAGNYGQVLGATSGGAYNEVIGSGRYFLQEEWSNEDARGSTDPNVGCRPRDEADPISLRAPAAARAGKRVSFRGSASDPDGHIVGYSWSFGDGTRAAQGRSVRHTYREGGSYRVVLRSINSAGNEATAVRTLNVSGPTVKVTLASGRLRVTVNRAGVVSFGGLDKRLRRAGTATFTLHLTARQRRHLAKRHSLRVRVTVKFVPRVGPVVRKTVTLILRG